MLWKKDNLIVINTMVNIGEIGEVPTTKDITQFENLKSQIKEEEKNNKFCDFININGKLTKVFNSNNVYLLFDKENYQVKNLMFKNESILKDSIELYSLVEEEVLLFHGIPLSNTGEHYNSLLEHNHIICLSEIRNYIDGHIDKNYYTVEELNQLIPQISEYLIQIDKTKRR